MGNAQVLPDWRGGDQRRESKLKEGALHSLRQKVRNLLKRGNRSLAVHKASLKQKRLANKWAIVACDRALRLSLGCDGLATFRPKRPPRPAQPTTRRYFVAIENLPASLRSQAQGRTRRACVQDHDAAPRLEMCWSSARPSLHQVIDQGSIGFGAKQYLYSKGGIRGSLDIDPPHRRHNNALWSLAQANLTWAKLEMQLLQCFSAAPWGGSAHFHSLKGASQEFFSNRQATWDLFAARYARISWQLHQGRLPPDAFSPDHMAFVWDLCQECWCFLRKGTRTRGGRWFQVFERASEHTPHFETLALVLEYIGLHEGWVELVNDEAPAPSPLDGATPFVNEISRQDSRPSEDTRRTTVAASNAAAETLMRKCDNYKHMAFTIVSNQSLHSIWTCLRTLIEPTMHEHNLTIVKQKTMEGGAAWLRDMVNCGYTGYLRNTLDLLGDEDMLVAAGFLSASSMGDFALFAKEEASRVAAALWDFVLKLLGSEVLWLRQYSHAPLFNIALLDDPQEKQATLEALQDWWETLLEAEAAVSEPENTCLKGALQSLQWAQSVWFREVMIGLDECEFHDIPGDLRQEVRAFARAARSTKTVEDAFNCVRDKTRHSKAGICGRKRRFHTIVESSILADCGRPPSGGESLAARLAAQEPLETSDFAAVLQSQDFSLGEDFLEKYMQTAETQGVSSWLSTSLVWSAICQTRGNWRSLSRAWVSLLAEPGDLIQKATKGMRGIVLNSSQWGVLVMDFTAERVQGSDDIYIQPAGSGMSIVYDCITEEADWRCREVVASPPCSSSAASLPKELCNRILLLVPAANSSMTLLERAARLAFRRLTVPLMQQAIVEWGIPYTGRRPTLEKDLAALLVLWALPTLSPEELESILQKRKFRRSSEFTTVVTSDNVEMLGATALGEGFEDERKSLETEAIAVRDAKKIQFEKVRKLRPPPSEVPRAAASSAAASSSSGAGRSTTQRKEIPDKAITLQEARMMIPQQVHGCVLAINKEVSWEVKYPRRASPNSHSAAFDPSDEGSQRAALLRCLRWVWRVHRECHPDSECPFALGEAI